jgi:hypothetical protein
MDQMERLGVVVLAVVCAVCAAVGVYIGWF